MDFCPTLHYFFFFNDTATTEIYTLSLHDALPISLCKRLAIIDHGRVIAHGTPQELKSAVPGGYLLRLRFGLHSRSEEHTSELQSRLHLVCRLLLEKKKNSNHAAHSHTLTM